MNSGSISMLNLCPFFPTFLFTLYIIIKLTLNAKNSMSAKLTEDKQVDASRMHMLVYSIIQ